jgi:hypothetical protein
MRAANGIGITFLKKIPALYNLPGTSGFPQNICSLFWTRYQGLALMGILKETCKYFSLAIYCPPPFFGMQNLCFLHLLMPVALIRTLLFLYGRILARRPVVIIVR